MLTLSSSMMIGLSLCVVLVVCLDGDDGESRNASEQEEEEVAHFCTMTLRCLCLTKDIVGSIHSFELKGRLPGPEGLMMVMYHAL